MLGYLRVSTEAQAAGDRTSLADQQSAIEALAARLGGTVEHWFRDEGASGATVEGRPAFGQMLAYCEAHPRPADTPGYVLFLNDSRFGRFPDPEEAAYWRHHLRRHGWYVRFAEGDVEGDHAPIMRAVGSVEATTYRRNLIQNTRRGMKGAGANGFWTREAPLGYRRREVGSGRVLAPGELKMPNERVKLTPHEGEAADVLWLFQQYAAGEPATSLGQRMAEKYPRRNWTAQGTIKVLKNPAYMGDVVGGRRKTRTHGIPREEYECRDAHPAIIPRPLWFAVQQRIGQNKKIGRAVAGRYMLSGVLKCAICGHPYVGGGVSSNAPDARFYRDRGGVAGECPGKIGTVYRSMVDEAAVDAVAEVLAGPEAQQAARDAFDKILRGEAGQDPAPGIRQRLDQLKRREQRTLDLIVDGEISREDGRHRLADVRGQIAAAEGQLKAAKGERASLQALAEERDNLLSVLRHFRALADTMTPVQRRDFVLPWIESAVFDKRTRELVLAVRPLPHPTLPAGAPLTVSLLPARLPGPTYTYNSLSGYTFAAAPIVHRRSLRGSGERG